MNIFKAMSSRRHTRPKAPIILLTLLSLYGCRTELDPNTDDHYMFAREDRIFSQSLIGNNQTTLGTRDNIFYAAINRSGDTACVWNHYTKSLALLKLKNGKIQERKVFPWYSHGGDWLSRSLSYLSINDEGTCLFDFKKHVGVLFRDAPAKIIKIPDEAFSISRITYSHSARRFIVTGKSSVFVVIGTQDDEDINPIRLHGSYEGVRVREGSTGEALSPDGKTLYAMVTALNDANSVKNLFASFDASTGKIIKFYLPYFRDGIQSFNDRFFTFSTERINPEGSSTSFALTPDGKSIYVAVWIDGNEIRTYIIDLASGQLQESSHYQEWSGFQISPSGKYAIEVKASADPNEADTYVYELSTGTLVNKIPGSYCAIPYCR